MLANHRDHTDRVAALAVATRGLDRSVDFPPGLIRCWLGSRDEGRFATIAATPESFQRIITQARAKVASASSPTARRRDCVAVARRTVARILSPAPAQVLTQVTVCAVHGHQPDADAQCQVIRRKGSSTPPEGPTECQRVKVETLMPLSAHRATRARHALAIVCMELLRSIREDHRDTALISGDWLGVQMGCRERPARAALEDCVSLGWLRVVTKAHRQSTRYKMPKLSRALGEVALARAETVDALAEGAPEIDPVAEVLAVVAHAAVGYDKDEHATVDGKRRVTRKSLDATAWLVALASEAGVDQVTLDVSSRAARDADRAWKRALAESGYEDDGITLRRALDEHASRVGADEQASQAEAARRVRAAEHKEGAETARAEKKARYLEKKAKGAASANAPIKADAPEPTAPEPTFSIERITVKLPHGFDSAKHQRALLKLIADNYGAGFDLDSIDLAAGTATASRSVAA